MENSDGRVVLTVSTKIDQSISRTVNDIKTKFETLKDTKSSIAALTQGIKDQQAVIKNLSIQYAELVAHGEGESEQAQQLQADISNLTAEMEQMQGAVETLGGSSTSWFSKMAKTLGGLAVKLAAVFSVYKIIQFSKSASETAMQTESSAKRLVSIYGEASNTVGDFIDSTAKSIGMSKSAAAQYAATYGNLFSSWADSATNAQLTNKYLQMTAVVASNTGRTVEDVQDRVRSGLLGNTESIEDLGIFVTTSTIEMSDAFKRMANGKSWEQLDEYTKQEIRAMAILEQATEKYGDTIMDTAATAKAEYQAAYEDFENSWGQLVNSVLVPALSVLSSFLQMVTVGLNALQRKSGKILDGVETVDTTTDAIAENIEQQTENLEDLNAELDKSLAGFDDILILTAQAAENTETLDKVATIGGSDEVSTTSTNYASDVANMLAPVTMLVGASLVALGCILLTKGKVKTGVELIAAGAVSYNVGAASTRDGLSPIMRTIFDALSVLVGAALITVGIILIATGVGIPLGIALIVAGASVYVTEIALNWNEIVAVVSSVIKAVKETVLGAVGMLALGVLIAVNANPALGVPLIMAGIAGLGYQAISPHWGYISEKVTEVWDSVKEVYDEKIKPGLDEVQEAWNALYEEHLAPVVEWFADSVLTPVIELIAVAFIAVLLGAIDSLAIGLTTAANIIGDATTLITDAISGVLNFINAAFSRDWDSAWVSLGDTVKNVFEDVVTICVDALNGLIGVINVGIDGINAISIPSLGIGGLSIPNIPQIPVPRLAKGAVIPANREFLAVRGDQKSGTNIETPLDTMVEAFNQALSNRNDTVKEEHYILDETELMTIIYKLAKQGQRAQGTDLVNEL